VQSWKQRLVWGEHAFYAGCEARYWLWVDDPDVTWHWRWCGIGSGKNSDGCEDISFWVIPYWSIVLPLAILSGYLILWKPRTKRKEQPNA
jgi:hypothetical protein